MHPRVIALAIALTAILICSSAVAAASRHFSIRQLSDDHVGRSKLELRAQMFHSESVIVFFRRHHWMLHVRRGSCWVGLGEKRTKVCREAREQFQAHRWLYRVAHERWQALYAPKPKPTRSLASAAPVPEGWLVGAFMCIHRYEGSWDANTGNGYYGGLQMDLLFQNSYGAGYLSQWGTADHWPVWAQIDAAVRAYKSGRGFYPWPNTARACGLI